MEYIALGAASFVIYFFFDIFTLKNEVIKKMIFGISGIILLVYSTYKIIVLSEKVTYFSPTIRLISSVLFIVSLLLLIYSLFLEIPFSKTYGKNEHNTELVDTGTYALCRHPGVLWLGLVFFFLYFITSVNLVLYAGVIWSFINVIYVVLQERYIFNKMFPDYEKYIKNTPMLIPNRQSIKKFIKTIT
ncbi:hypothetical protein RJG79_11615 [Mycoplasmatota bacterium WC44]